MATADAAAQGHVDRARDRGGGEQHDADEDEHVRPPRECRGHERRADDTSGDREHHGEVHVERARGLEQARDSPADQQDAERERGEERRGAAAAVRATGAAGRPSRRRCWPGRAPVHAGGSGRTWRSRSPGAAGTRSAPVGPSGPPLRAGDFEPASGPIRRRESRRRSGAAGSRGSVVGVVAGAAQEEDRETSADQQQRRAEVMNRNPSGAAGRSQR